jgi:Ca-activated chloride channel homolog
MSSRHAPSRDRRTALCRVALGVTAAVAGLAVILGAQAPPTAVAIVTPPAASYVSGPAAIRVALTPAPSGPVRVTIYADGRLVCTLDREPWQCAWDAGDAVTAHEIRAVATLSDGQRLVSTVKTSDAGYTERADVDAVQVTVTVTDGSGNNVSGLSKSQFKILEDDVPQKIDYFAGGNAALEVVTAIDVSGSMTDAMPQLKKAVTAFLGALRPEDAVSLLAFNDNIFSLTRASTDPAARGRAIDRLEAWGGTALYDVTVKSVETLGRQRGRRALVIFTDGEDTSSRTTLPFVEQRLERSDAVVYCIAQGRGTSTDALKTVLERLARKSGGRAFFTDDIGRLGEAFSQILDELAHQYLLSYSPPAFKRDGAWHRIKVQVPGQNYTIRAREGYRAPAR